MCGDWDGWVLVRHPLSGQLLCSERKAQCSIQAIACLENAVAAAYGNGLVVVWRLNMNQDGDAQEWSLVEVFSQLIHNASVTGLAWSKCVSHTEAHFCSK